MKKILIVISFAVSIFIIGLVSINSHTVQDRILNIGLKNILSGTEPFLDREDTLKVVVCGSRSPLPSPGRAEACILVEAGDDIYIFDLGNGSMDNLAQYQVPWPNVKAILITHMHSDHIADLPDAHLQSWVQGRNAPLMVYGPEGINLVTKGFVTNLTPDLTQNLTIESSFRNSKGKLTPNGLVVSSDMISISFLQLSISPDDVSMMPIPPAAQTADAS